MVQISFYAVCTKALIKPYFWVKTALFYSIIKSRISIIIYVILYLNLALKEKVNFFLHYIAWSHSLKWQKSNLLNTKL